MYLKNKFIKDYTVSLLYIINMKTESLEVLQELCCLPPSVIDVVGTVRKMSSAQQIIGWNSRKWVSRKMKYVV